MALKDKKTKLTFHSGVLTIGGTVIEIRYENSRIFFDFGAEYKPELDLKDESLKTMLEHNLIPHLDGVYDPAFNYTYPYDHDETIEETAIFLSHVHLDHTRMLNFSDPKIPVYALKETQILLNSLNANGDFILPKVNPEDNPTRDINPCENGDVVTVGDIKVTLLRVDHDAYGACGLIIETPDLNIAYTGDLRLHGFDKDDTMTYIEHAKDTDVLIIEGVTVSFDPETTNEVDASIHTEQQLVDRFVSLQNENPNKQITFNAYPANIKRLAEINHQSPREVVFTAEFASILKSTIGLDVRYYEIGDVHFSLDSKYEIRYDELLEDDHKYLWQIDRDYENLKGGGVYIHSNAVPLGPFDPAYEPFVKALEENEVEFYELRCSGHAYPDDLQKIIDEISPELLIPIHSLKPERLVNPQGKRYLPKRGNTI